MRAIGKAAVAAIAASVVVGLIVYFWITGLSRAAELANVIALFVAISATGGSFVAWTTRRRQSPAPITDPPQSEANRHGDIQLNIGQVNKFFYKPRGWIGPFVAFNWFFKARR